MFLFDQKLLQIYNLEVDEQQDIVVIDEKHQVSELNAPPELKKAKFDVNSLLEKPNLFWKATRPRYSVQFFCCKECNDFNYKHTKNNFSVDEDRLKVTVSLCPFCIMINYDITNVLYRKKI